MDMDNRQLEDGNRIAQRRINHPSIISVIGQRVELRRAGREYKGLCPFHSEKTPSFTVNEENGVFYCFGCGAKGDVFDFIMKVDGVTFPEARARLGTASKRPSPKAADPVSDTAKIITRWANELTTKVNSQLCDIGQRARVAGLADWREEINLLGREWILLEILADDLQDETVIIQLWRERETIENLFEDLPEGITTEEFPPLTVNYWAMIKSYGVEVAADG